ncbi:unnamed protein product [Caenorhabditis brenneri]
MQNDFSDFLPDIMVNAIKNRQVSIILFEVNQTNSSQADTVKEVDLTKSLKNLLPETCAVCGNRAIGYHYDVPSCNGCKAFFRRTIITGNKFACKRSNNCLKQGKITSRRLCPGCRFAKCEKVGMNPMNIRAEISENGRALREKYLENQTAGTVIPRMQVSIEDELNSAISTLMLVENQIDKLFNSSLPPHYGDLRSLTEVLNMTPILDATKIPNLIFLEHELFPIRAGFVHNTCLSVIEFVKIFGSFSKLTHDSVQKLIKHGLFMCGGLMSCRRSIRKFNSDCLRHTDGSIAGKPTRSWNGIWVDHKTMIHKVLYSFIRTKLDDVEYIFLKAIVICNPAVPDLLAEDAEAVEKERFKHAKNLLKYCLKTHGNIHGPDRFASILSIISVMETQQKEEKSFYVILRSYYSYANHLVSPLYDEIMSS